MQKQYDEIWKKAIAILESSTLKALLSQECFLNQLEDDYSSAIINITVGVRSPELLSLLQQEIENIETAFTQVLQQKVKVTLKARKLNPEQINYKRRSSLNDDEIMTILEGFNLAVYAYTGDFDAYSLGQKAFYLQNMISLVLRFENVKDLGSLTKEKIAFTKELLLDCHTKIFQKPRITNFNPYLN